MKEKIDIYEVISYVEALKSQLRDNKISDSNVANIVKSLPNSSVIRKTMSDEEVQLVFESARWAWKEISGNDINDMIDILESPESLSGNYWMVSNGVILHGVNHYVIIKRNITLFANLLSINAFLIHQKLSGPPEGLIKLIIDHGGMRIFVDKEKKSYFQINETSYKNWGREKIKKFDFKEKIVKLIDPSCQFTGWKSGITIHL